MNFNIKMNYTKGKKIQDAYIKFHKSRIHSLEQAYKNPSENKKIAFNNCMLLVKSLNGCSPYITSYNTFHFSIAFFGEYKGEQVFVYVTPYKVYYCNTADLLYNPN